MEQKRKIISELNRLDLNTVNYEEIRIKIRELLQDTIFECIELERNQKLFRARITKNTPATIADMASPENSLVTNFQRCNPPDRAVFYCSSCRNSALREIGAKVGDTVFMSEWIVGKEFIAVSISPKGDCNKFNNKSFLVSSFFETKFSQPIHEVFSAQYKISSAIFEELINKIHPIAENTYKTFHGVNSLIYPSTANKNISDCVAIDPAFAKKHLKITYVEKIHIDKINKNSVEYTMKKRSYVFDDSSKILWPKKEGEILCGSKDNISDYNETTNFI